MTSTYTANLSLQQQGTGDNPGSWGTNLNANVITLIDQALGATYAANVAGSSDVTLSQANAGNLIHNLTGALTGNINYIFPLSQGGSNVGRFLIIKNATSGAFTVTVKPIGGTGIAIPQGTTQFIYIDSSNTTAYQPISASGLGALVAANNLSDLASASTARTNLGLGSTITGSGNTVLATAPTLSNPVVGTQAITDSSTKGASTAFAKTTMTTQVFTSGSAATYTTPSGALFLKVRFVGGGGGGGGTGTSGQGAGGTGGTTTFNSINANGGTGGGAAVNAASTGVTSGIGGSSGTGSAFFRMPGANGSSPISYNANYVSINGADGGNSFFGGKGSGGANSAGGGAGTNTGSGGGGGGPFGINATGGAGGGAGEYVELIITNPSATYTYTVGAAGTAGGAGSSGVAGGAGAVGIIIVEEYYIG